MASDRELQIIARHAEAVVNDTDQRLAAAGGRHLDATRAGVDGVLDQLLHDARRPLDDLTRRDAVDHVVGELADAIDSHMDARPLDRGGRIANHIVADVGTYVICGGCGLNLYPQTDR